MLTLSLFVSVLTLIPFGVKAKEQPVIQLHSYPRYGEQSMIVGQIVQEDGSACSDYSEWSVIFYIQIEDGQPYYVKPGTRTDGCFDTVSIQPDGSFFGAPFSYGEEYDPKARYIHVFLVPADFLPTSDNYEEALDASLDHIKITRYVDGTVKLLPARFASETDAPLRNTNLTVSQNEIALNVDFYTTGERGRELTEDEIKIHLETIRPFTNTVHFFSASDPTIRKAYRIAHDMGFQIIGTAWICGDRDQDQKEMDALIEFADLGWISLACVGSETQYEGYLFWHQLARDIRYVRKNIPEEIPVTTAEPIDIVIAEPEIRNACDVFFVNYYPLYEGVSVDLAVSHLADQVSILQALGEGKQVIISETGYATAGSSEANEENAVKYFEAVRDWSAAQGIVTVFFMSADAEWKSVEDAYGPHWGILTKELELKPGFARVLS